MPSWLHALEAGVVTLLATGWTGASGSQLHTPPGLTAHRAPLSTPPHATRGAECLGHPPGREERPPHLLWVGPWGPAGHRCTPAASGRRSVGQSRLARQSSGRRRGPGCVPGPRWCSSGGRGPVRGRWALRACRGHLACGVDRALSGMAYPPCSPQYHPLARRATAQTTHRVRLSLFRTHGVRVSVAIGQSTWRTNRNIGHLGIVVQWHAFCSMGRRHAEQGEQP
jgi:hypothetical protein